MKNFVFLLVALVLAGVAGAAEAEQKPMIFVYGPGGPAPAVREAAEAFGAANDVSVVVASGPTTNWVDKARNDADVLYTGSENMVHEYAKAIPNAFDPSTAEPLYLRPVVILVRPGNPKGIHGINDLLKTGVKILVVAHGGQIGLWEDVVGRTGDIEMVRAFRRNMVFPAATSSSVALARWKTDKDIDAWLVWNIWSVANPGVADVVPIEEQYRIYRDTGVLLTRKGAANPKVKAFVDFLKSKEGRAIFVKWGWEGR
ncbi:substrate-binding domain-containing protein [Rhodoblastus sp.]|uniref:substrate-binding domain-containing protein n=1 Tax=Rhodoblastus sp. TaxID=1962975 RepID=UPI002616716B|nr:substrate-binding domain-containing protein [Rhodoblastus sp.]